MHKNPKKSMDIWKTGPRAPMIEKMLAETDAERMVRIRKVCFGCAYRYSTSISNAARSTCDYNLITGHSRPYAVTDCVKAGVYRPAKSTQPVRPFTLKKEQT